MAFKGESQRQAGGGGKPAKELDAGEKGDAPRGTGKKRKHGLPKKKKGEKFHRRKGKKKNRCDGESAQGGRNSQGKKESENLKKKNPILKPEGGRGSKKARPPGKPTET